MRILMIGDIVGSSGRKYLLRKMPELLEQYPSDVVIANGENAAAGLGIQGRIARELHEAGVDVITLGNHTWSKREIFQSIESDPALIRPGNVSSSWPGTCHWTSRTTPRVLVINVIGQVYMDSADNPFHFLDRHLPEWKKETGATVTVVDFHAEATAEKAAMARFLDGRVTLVAGTHTHVQTADEQILERGTAFISDVGMTGPVDSVIGMNPESSLRRFVDRLPAPFEVAHGRAMINAVAVEADGETGQARHIERIRWMED